MKIAVIGATGQLGHDLVKALTDEQVIPLAHADVEICEAESVQAMMAQHRPQAVINLAAYHKVDECEGNPDRSFAVNALGVRSVALACREHGATLVHLSTDYVFDGHKGRPYTEDDAPHPINVYGVSKLAGEYLVRYLCPQHFVVRSSGLYGVAGSSGKGGNFVELMLRLAREGKDIRVVDDQVLTPTYTVDLARAIARLIQTEHYGLYHITSAGACSWFQFAGQIFELAGVSPNLSPTTTGAFGAAATRPPHSVLENAALARIGLDDMRPWQEALAAYLAERQAR
ncbi:MAG: dTDP-4-dehydrorhamnose reductase [Chloroflexi bacterium]|nr:dTDP-4-dehydrorhamnose reductase [Chloroflexota bacterium]MBU1750008.1 dTDP-4-dehydrorhamnose reductase [Chloroflexota bacterium]MBU1878862.1 dTDP-4-dehydrorhamnose reductase [Chloroflexota bacterium]